MSVFISGGLLLSLSAPCSATIRLVLPEVVVYADTAGVSAGYFEVTVAADSEDFPQEVSSLNVELLSSSSQLTFGQPLGASTPLLYGVPLDFAPNATTLRAALDVFPDSQPLVNGAGLVYVPFSVAPGILGDFQLTFGGLNQLADANASEITITLSDMGTISVRLAGDYNGDGVVDALDYAVWRESLGETGVRLAADGNGDEVVDSDDFNSWQENYGATTAAPATRQNVSAPEPYSELLAMAIALSAVTVRRRNAHFKLLGDLRY